MSSTVSKVKTNLNSIINSATGLDSFHLNGQAIRFHLGGRKSQEIGKNEWWRKINEWYRAVLYRDVKCAVQDF